VLSNDLPAFLTQVETAIIKFLLQNNFEDRPAVVQQLQTSVLESRDLNGHGFFTHFKLPETTPLCEKRNFELGDVCAIVSGEPCGFILFVRDHKISWLEGFSLGEDGWPSSETIEKVGSFKSC
jgi:hypothetical protein